MFGVQLEELENKYIAFLQAHLPAALAEVASYWSAKGDPVPLPPIGEWHTGNIPDDAVLYVVRQWPALTVEATNLQPTANNETGVGLVDSLLVKVYQHGDTPAIANKLTKRYAVAVASVLTPDKPNGIKRVGSLSISDTETFTSTRKGYLKASRLSVTLTVGAIL